MTEGPAGPAWRPAWPWLLLALALGAGAVALLLSPAPPAPPPPAAAARPTWAASPFDAARAGAAAEPAATETGPASRPASAPATTAAPAAASAPASDDLAAHVPPGVVPTMNQVIDQLHQRGIRTGLGAFNPPGTKPALVGLAVPEGFELPPGYLRHRQATDDGQAIEAILMFDPDHPPPAAAGRSLRTPAERVVPPELAPPGLVPRTITLPPPLPAPVPPSPGSAPR